MTHQSSDVRQEVFEETHLFCGSAPATLLSAAHKHIRQVELKLRLQRSEGVPTMLPEGPSGCFCTCWDFTDHFGIFLELDVVITLKLQQHHLQVDVVAHLKLPHRPVGLPVQGCCRGNVATESEMVRDDGDSLSIRSDSDVQNMGTNTNRSSVWKDKQDPEGSRFFHSQDKLYFHPGLFGYMRPTN